MTIAIIAATCVIAIAAIAFVLGVRPKDLPKPEPVSPFQHLDERKAAIYENLRDLQFEYRLGKLSDHDYQVTKQDLQKELAKVLAEVDRLKKGGGADDRVSSSADGAQAPSPAARQEMPADDKTRSSAPRLICPHCNAKFDRELKFCGECGKPMQVPHA